MSADGFTQVATLGELPPGKTLCMDVEGRAILLCRTAEGVYAVDNECTHAAESLASGKLKGHRIFCPLHGASFDVRDGSPLSRPATIPLGTYPVRIEGEAILLSLESP